MCLSSHRIIRSGRLLYLVVIGGLGSACAEKPFLLEGNAYGAAVGYGRDLTGATAIAKQHCAGFERVAEFREAADNIAHFDCVVP